MPRISDARRRTRRNAIFDAARRCFARNGFHQTSMPELLAEAGLSAGAFYRYFTSKEELILEIARDAFDGLRAILGAVLATNPAPTVGEIVAAVVGAFEGGTVEVDGRRIDLDDQLRCAVQAWSETLRNDDLRAVAEQGFGQVRDRVAEALDAGRRGGRVRADLDPSDGAQLVTALLPGYVLQRVVFGAADPAAFVRAATTLLDPAVPLRTASSSLSQE